MYPEATLKRPIPGVSVVLEGRSPFRLGFGFLLVFTFLVIARIQEVLPALAPFRLALISAGLAMLGWLLAPGSFQEKVPTRLRPVRYMFILVALAVFTIPIAVWPGHSLEFLTGNYSKTVVLFLLVVFWCRSIQDMRKLMWVCCLGGVALVVTGILTGQVGDARFSADSQTYDPNDLALLMVMLLPLVLYLLSTSGAFGLIVASGMALVVLYGIIRTQSRSGLVALMAVGALLLWRSTLTRGTKVILALAAFLVFGVLAGSAYWQRMDTILTPQTEYDATAGGRTEIWKTALVLLATHPLGVGIDGFVTAEGLYHGGIGKWSTAHNSLLQIGVELGVAGLIVFLLWITRTLRDLRSLQAKPKKITMPAKLKKQEEVRDSPNPIGPLAAALEISLWGFVVGGFFLSQAYSGLLYIVLALSVVCMRLENQNPMSVQKPKVYEWGMKRKPLPPLSPMNP